jgi:hypothetical protein
MKMAFAGERTSLGHEVVRLATLTHPYSMPLESPRHDNS